MKTDTLFYELFQAAPQTFFELMGMTPPCAYRFESLTVKTSEIRIDGVLEPLQAGQAIYFVEVQATPDAVIYWRTLREVATFFEQRPDRKETNWQAIVLWLNSSDDPGLGTLMQLGQSPSPRLLAADLSTLLRKLPPSSLVGNVLRPLIVESEQEVRQNIAIWADSIQNTPEIEPQTGERLVAILSQFIEQKFRTLTYKELSEMLRLTPLAETNSGQELIRDERVALLVIQIRQKFSLNDSMIDAITTELQRLDLESLKMLFAQIFHIATIEELEGWIDAHRSEVEV